MNLVDVFLRKRILVIEDEERILQFLRRGLAYEGYRVETAIDGVKSLALARETIYPDLVILAFNETLERLEGLFDMQRRFLADVSHELPTPLTTIRRNIDLIRRMGEVDPLPLDAITSEVDRMTRLVRDLLLLAHAEKGKLPLQQEGRTTELRK